MWKGRRRIGGGGDRAELSGGRVEWAVRPEQMGPPALILLLLLLLLLLRPPHVLSLPLPLFHIDLRVIKVDGSLTSINATLREA